MDSWIDGYIYSHTLEDHALEITKQGWKIDLKSEQQIVNNTDKHAWFYFNDTTVASRKAADWACDGCG